MRVVLIAQSGMRRIKISLFALPHADDSVSVSSEVDAHLVPPVADRNGGDADPPHHLFGRQAEELVSGRAPSVNAASEGEKPFLKPAPAHGQDGAL